MKPTKLEQFKEFFCNNRRNIVRIIWKNPKHDWHYFRVLGVRGYRVKLKGEYDPEDRATHCGDEFWCAISGVKEARSVGVQ